MCVYVPEDYHQLVASLRHTPPADEQHPHQLSESVARALVDSDDIDILGACAGSFWESGDGAVKLDRNIRSTTRY